MAPVATKETLERLASRQGGRLHHHQISQAGLSRDVIRTMVRHRQLILTLPKVYAYGYIRTDRTALIWDAILYAGPGAALTGASGAFELGLLFYVPGVIKVATPRNLRNSPPV